MLAGIILIHQLIFQGMFLIKNFLLMNKLGRAIRGKNREAQAFTIFAVFFIGLTIAFSFLDSPPGRYLWILQWPVTLYLAVPLLIASLIVSGLSLFNLGDSWRVGVIDEERTNLITSGIYGYSRNPYFLSYLLMFLGYSVILLNWILLGLTVVGFFFVYWMIKKEESYLLTVHGKDYEEYLKTVGRFFII